jgi:DNA-binding MarR family transcriptional regulator
MVFQLAEDLGFLMARTHRAMRRALMARLEPAGITYPQFQVLNALCEEENVSQIALADRVNVDKTSLARMLDRMEAAGLISRGEDPEDSRVKRITLTGKGRRLQDRVTPLRDRVLGQVLKGLSEEEVRELKRLLNRVYNNVSKVTGTAVPPG